MSFFLNILLRERQSRLDIKQERDGLAQFVASLMLNKFMYKGTEDPQNVSDSHTNSDRALGY